MSQEGEPQGAPGGGSEKKGGRPTPLDVAVPPGQGRHSWQKQDQQRCDTTHAASLRFAPQDAVRG